MKKLIILGMLVLVMCSLTACGKDNAVDRTAGQAVKIQEDAQDAVREHNEQVLETENRAGQIEEELE